jgi:hypothetical protein
MFIIVAAMFVVHVTIMQVIGVVSMFDLGVTAVLSVLMVVIFMYFAFFVSHDPLLLLFHYYNLEYRSIKQFSRKIPRSYASNHGYWHPGEVICHAV